MERYILQAQIIELFSMILSIKLITHLVFFSVDIEYVLCEVQTQRLCIMNLPSILRSMGRDFLQFLYQSVILVFLFWGADKSLARPGKKQVTATKLGIYSTYSPRSSVNLLARCSNFCKPLKKCRRLSVQLGLRGSND